MTLEGVVINGQIVLKEPQPLPEGAKVQVMVQTIPVRLPDDEWVRILKELPIDCGVSLSNEALSSEGLYD
jgi:hypothetical protein